MRKKVVSLSNEDSYFDFVGETNHGGRKNLQKVKKEEISLSDSSEEFDLNYFEDEHLKSEQKEKCMIDEARIED